MKLNTYHMVNTFMKSIYTFTYFLFSFVEQSSTSSISFIIEASSVNGIYTNLFICDFTSTLPFTDFNLLHMRLINIMWRNFEVDYLNIRFDKTTWFYPKHP